MKRSTAPLVLCPECLHKLLAVTGVSPYTRDLRLEQFYAGAELLEAQRFAQARLRYLDLGPPAQ